MEKPTITINDKEIEMVEIKARTWRKIMEFDATRNDILTVDAVDKYCEIIATAFGVTVDDVLDNLNLDDVVPKYFEVFDAVVKLLFSKFNKKNVEVAEEI